MLPQSATRSVLDELSKDKTETRRLAPYPFTQFPNALYALLPRLSGSETKLLWVILRYTFGFQAHDQPAAISLSKFERETGLTRETVSNALNSLLSRGIIERRGEGTERGRYRVIVPPGPALVGKSDQTLVEKSDHALVGKSDHTKESSSVKRIPAKKDSSGHSVRNATTNAPDRASFLPDDDVVARLSKPREGLSPEQELTEIIFEKTGLPLKRVELRQIKENLELRNSNIESFVNEVRRHQNGHWRNPIGFLISLSKKAHSQMQIATSLPAMDEPQKCRCFAGFAQRSPDVFCESCSLGKDLKRLAQRDEKRKRALALGAAQ